VGANIIALCNLQPSQSLSFHRSWTSRQASFHILRPLLAPRTP